MITSADTADYTFRQYRKVGTTSLSDEILPVGTRVETLEGEYVCAEPSRLAIDADGNVYPVAESVRLASYELADDAQKTYTVTINGKVPTRAMFEAHGAHTFASSILGAMPDDSAEFTDRTQADELAARCAHWFPEDTVKVETR